MLKNIIVNNLSQSLLFGSRWLLNILLVRILSKTEFGIFSFLYSISNILVSFLPFGSSIYIFKENKKGNNKLIIESLFIVLMFIFIIFLIYFFLKMLNIEIKGLNYLPYSFILGFFLSVNLLFSSYLKSLEFFKKDLIANFLFSILLFLFVIYIFSMKTIKIEIIFEILILINSLVSIYFFKQVQIDWKELRIFSYNLKNALKSRIYYGLQEIQTSIYAQSSMIILFYLLNTNLYGIYRALFIIIMPISMITFSIAQVSMVSFKKNIDKIKDKFRKMLYYMIVFSLFTFVLLYMLEPYLFRVINIDNVYHLEFIILISAIFIKIIMTPYVALLVVLNKQKVRFYANLVGSAFLLISIFIFVGKNDLLNAMLIYCIAIFIICCIKIYFSEKELKSL